MTTDICVNHVYAKENATYVWKIDWHDNTIRRKLTCVKSSVKPSVNQSRKTFAAIKYIIRFASRETTYFNY